MLLDEDPATVHIPCILSLLTNITSQLISHTIANFSLHPDKSALSRISTTLSTLSQSRSQRLSNSQAQLTAVNRKVQSLANNHSSLVNEHNSSAHAELIMELDAQKFRIAKGARDAEEEGERLGVELEGLKKRLDKLDLEGVEGGQRRRGGAQEDATLLVLFWFLSLMSITLDIRWWAWSVYGCAC
jgi:kinetochore protein Spc24, fungi type